MPNPITARLALENFDPAIAVELRALHNVQPGWNWVCLLYPVLWIASAVVMARYPYWWVQIPGIVAMA